MTLPPVRFALVGCGENAKKSIVPALLQCSMASVLVTMDVHLHLAQDLADETGAERCTDRIEGVLDDDQVEVVILSTPHYLHVDQGVEAAERGKHVLMDKPLATNVPDAERLIGVCRERGVLLGVLFPMRMTSLYAAAADLVARGVLGRTTGFACTRLWKKPSSYWSGGYSGRVRTDWRAKKQTSGGGMLMINYSHNLDRLHNLLGLNPQSVYAQYDTFDTPVQVEDYFSVVVRYAGGAIGSLLGSSATPGGTSHPDRIFGTQGTIELSEPLRYYTAADLPGVGRETWTEVPCSGQVDQGYLALIENYARAVRGEQDLIVTGTSALSSLQVIEGAYRSQEEGAPVEL